MRKVLEPIEVGKMKLRNRVLLSAMAKYFCVNGYIGREYIEYYRTIAKGGTALIVPGIMVLDPNWYSTKEQPFLSDDKYIPGLKAAVEAIHAEGAKIAFQPWMPGHLPYTQHDYPEVYGNGPILCAVNYMPKDMIRKMQSKYYEGIERCVIAGADAIEFHMAHNYLPEQFYSPYLNRRTDEYGAQNVENAMRFATELLTNIKKDFGDQIEIIAKMNGSDFHEGTASMRWLGDAAAILEHCGVSMITVNAGGIMSRQTGMSGDGNMEEGWKVPFAEVVKKRVKIPVAACGNLCHPDYIDRIISDGKCDLAALGRELLAEPEWVDKVREGREDELRYCVSCMHCQTKAPITAPGCTVNPRGRREYAIPEMLNKNGDKQLVAVVGAGPAGLEAAVTLAKRDFRVILHEKSDSIGGAVKLAAIPIGKQKLNWMLDYYSRMIKKLGVDLKLNIEVSPKELKTLSPYGVIVATGSREFLPRVEGINGANVINIRDYLSNQPAITGKSVAILGAGVTGLEAARMLQTTGNQVAVLDMLPDEIPNTVEHRLALLYARESGAKVFMEHKIIEVREDAVVTSNINTKAEKVFHCDLVITSLGAVSNDDLYIAVKDFLPNVYNIGDSEKTAKIAGAISEGYRVAAALPAKPYTIVSEPYFAHIKKPDIKKPW
jgi:2,4-dienoyl-CoA reductase-like NADH-dependent reductase (Old Yellow Enzyme family)/thioredoxin reductase